MIVEFIRRTLRNSSGTLAAVVGWMAVGAVLGQLGVAWISLMGTAYPALTALLISLCGGFVISRRPAQGLAAAQRRQAPDRSRNLVTAGSATATLLLMTWLLPTLLLESLRAGCQLWSVTTSSLQPQTLSSVVLALSFPTAVMAIVAALACIWRPLLGAHTPLTAGSIALSFSTGAVLLLLPVVTTSGRWLPLAVPVTVLVCMTAVLQMARQLRIGSSAAADADSTPLEIAAAAAPVPSRTLTQGCLLGFAGGLLLCSSVDILTRLMPASLPLALLTLWCTAGLIRVADIWLIRRWLPTALQQATAVLICSSLPLMFNLLTDFNLSLKAATYSPILLMFIRSLQCSIPLAASLLPLFLIWPRQQRQSLAFSPIAVTATGVGLLLGWLMLASGVTPVSVLALAASLLAAICMADRLVPAAGSRTADSANAESNRPGERSRWQLAGAVAAVAVCPLLTLSGTPDTARATQLLFSTRSLAALQLGVATELIPQSDASRLVASRSTSRGELQVWHRNGHVFEFRCHGLPLGQVSRDTQLTPQPVEEILPAILPLVTHAAPGRILLLGDETGACLRVCSRFPLQRVVAIRSDRRITELAQQYTWSRLQPAPQNDPRVTLLHGSAALALQTQPELPFDVLIITSDSAAAASAAWQFTDEFYRAASRQLTTDGIFCQRFRQQDLGAAPLQQTMATAMRHFRNVVAVQTIPGEMVLLAGHTERRFLDEHVLARLQQDFIRQEIATAGWDWTQVAILPMLDAADPVGLFSQQSPPPAVSIATGQFSLELPFEVTRRSPRAAELQTAFAPYQLRLAEAVPPGEAHQEIKRRLSLISQQVEILAGMPDEPWTYRRSLRTEMQRNPRPPKEVISDSKIIRTAHPTDQLQQDYFITLGQSLQQVLRGQTSARILEPLAAFTEQHEPLLSFFAHYELIRLHEMAGHPAPADEYRHRLHTVFFSEQSDASVRPVIAAIQHLTQHPEILPSDAERFDQMNSMVQKLIERWEARTAWEPKSASRVQNDVDQSLEATQQAIEKMEQWASAVGWHKDDVLRRRRFINAALIVPLRSYREQVLAHRLKTETPQPPDGETPDDLPLMLNPQDLLTN